MFTGEWPRSVYCWALPSSWGPPCYGKIGFATSAREPQRGRAPCAVRASFSAEHSRESDDAYRQFANMLGEGSPSKPRTNDAKSAAYAEFADRLGLDDSNREDDDKNKSVAKLSPKKVEIDPADYYIFDEMLERTGGRGKRPIKGAKPYSRYTTRDSKVGKTQRMDDWDPMHADVSTETVQEEEDVDSPTVPGLTEEEKAQAYAVMMEEFGPGSDYGVETWTPDDDVDESDPPSSQLMKPPERAGVPRPVEPATRTATEASAYDLGEQQDIQEHIESLALQPRPFRPSPDKSTSHQEGTKVIESHSEEETTDLSPPEVPLDRAAAELDPETQLPEHEEHIQLQDEQEARSFEVQDLKAPPIRPAQAQNISDEPHVSAEGKLSTVEAPTLDADFETSEEVAPTIIPKPQRGQEPLAASAVAGSFEIAPRSNQRRGLTRRGRLRKEEPDVLLSNPKLVYQNE